MARVARRPAGAAAAAVRVDDQVAELAREPVLAVVDAAVQHQPAADPGADVDQDQVAAAGPGPEPGLGPGGGVAVVVDAGRQAGALVQEAAQLHAAVAVVGGPAGVAARPLHQPGRPDPDRLHPGIAGPQLRDQVE
jgi:hypothetical protein